MSEPPGLGKFGPAGLRRFWMSVNDTACLPRWRPPRGVTRGGPGVRGQTGTMGPHVLAHLCGQRRGAPGGSTVTEVARLPAREPMTVAGLRPRPGANPMNEFRVPDVRAALDAGIQGTELAADDAPSSPPMMRPAGSTGSCRPVSRAIGTGSRPRAPGPVPGAGWCGQQRVKAAVSGVSVPPGNMMLQWLDNRRGLVGCPLGM